ncbi:MAG: immunoglobulin domain-containing protein, partial [Acidobacteriota bacterium]
MATLIFRPFMMKINQFKLLGLLACLTIASCSGSGTAPPATNTNPVITWFTASPPGEAKNFNTILRGQNAVLQYSFLNGTGVITPSVGIVTSEVLSTVTPQVTTTYTLTVTSQSGNSVSATAIVNVNTPPSISLQPLAVQTVAYGSPATLNIVATASDSLSYQWFKSGKAILGATSNTLSIPQVTEDGVYRCDVTNTLNGTSNTIQSNNANLYVNKVEILTQPIGGEIQSGGTFTLSALGSGSGVISYQWKKDGTNIDNAILSSYNANSIGIYTCAVTSNRNNVSVTQISNPATVVAAPVATSLTAGSGTITSGSSTTLTPTFSGGTGVITPGNTTVTSGVATT